MNPEVSFFNFSLNNILSKKLPIVAQARIRLLYYGLLIIIIANILLLANVYMQHQPVLTITAGILLLSSLGFFKLLTYRPRWKVISHGLLSLATVVNLSLVYITLQQVNVITIQMVILVVLFSFYMLGQTAGFFYSVVNLIPVLMFLVIEYNGQYIIPFKPEYIDALTIIIAIFANFVLIVFVHSHFYNAFYKNIQQLKKNSRAQAVLNYKLEAAIEKAGKSSQAKSEFLATMSHEIRTPLNAVIGMSNLLMMNDPRADQKENLELLKYSASNLLAIVNDVLDFNKIEAGKIVFENVSFNLIELMQSICGSQKLKAEEKGILFKLDIDSRLSNKVLFGDPTRLTQVIYNLVSNAIKFTKDGNILVRVTCVEDRHNTVNVNFLVKDTGIGIEKTDLDTIFEPFTQESMTITRQYGGTGLGLAIIKRLLELQNLKMQVTSEVNEGSEFSFSMEFPVSTQNIEQWVESRPEQVPNAQIENLRVLIAEDNPVNVLLMKKLFAKWNMTPTIAENGERAVEMMQYGNFDIILMDLQMPVLNGFDAAVEIRNLPDPKKSRIPIIALTASALLDIREKVLNAGMNDYVAKPFKPQELLSKIQGLVVA